MGEEKEKAPPKRDQWEDGSTAKSIDDQMEQKGGVRIFAAPPQQPEHKAQRQPCDHFPKKDVCHICPGEEQ